MNNIKSLRLGLILIVISAIACTGNNEPQQALSLAAVNQHAESTASSVAETEASEAETVYVCNSAGAKKYHFKQDCCGIKRCKHEIEKMTRKAAEGMGLGLCGYED